MVLLTSKMKEMTSLIESKGNLGRLEKKPRFPRDNHVFTKELYCDRKSQKMASSSGQGSTETKRR